MVSPQAREVNSTVVSPRMGLVRRVEKGMSWTLAVHGRRGVGGLRSARVDWVEHGHLNVYALSSKTRFQ